ncbi:hypothetical protein GF314_09125 [bacterium]|nr:hypothetical protein [bacterium]
MPTTLDILPVDEPALPSLARWLLAHRPGPGPEDLADALVLLPSQRACGQLQHALLEASGEGALLLPWITTPGRLALELADLVGAASTDVEDPALRRLILAPALARLDWLRERPEAAGGLAAELVGLFDEVRFAGRASLLDGGTDDEALLRHVEAGGEHVLRTDLARIRQAWRLYRAAIDRDHVDRALEALASAAARWPGDRPAMVVAAHLGRLDRVTGQLLAALAGAGTPVHWLTLGADTPRARLLLATYRDAASPVHPLATARLLAERQCGVLPDVPVVAGDDLAARLDALGADREALRPGGAIDLRACRDPEHESRVVAATVCDALREADPVPEVVVASPDRDLAARIAAQLREAGIDVDDTRGRSLATLPAGRLLREVLRTVTGGWPFGAVIELLTHPYVRLPLSDARPGHAVRTRLLETAIRRASRARAGRETLARIAADEDADRERTMLTPLVTALAEALAPLDRLRAGAITWPAFLAAVREVWSTVAPARPLDGDAEPHGDHDDVGAVDDLLGRLETLADRLATAPLTELAATFGELLREVEVRPRRQRHLPVRVMGLVEARLERADLLVLAGLAQDVFPGSLPRPLFLGDRVRRALGLEHWRAKAGRDAELLLRLLEAGARVSITWPLERDGRPSLPSPLVQRLVLVAAEPPPPAAEPVAHRRTDVPTAAMVAAERAFRAEPEPIPAPAVVPPARLSHTALQNYRECPYRFLMSHGLGLRRQDELEAEFTAREQGRLAHAVMERWLAPDGPAVQALAAGDAATAGHELAVAIDGIGDEASGLPGAAVALQDLRALAPELVAHEIARLSAWRPVVLEARFELTLGDVATWLEREGIDAPAVAGRWAATPLTGAIDRVDVARDGSPRAVVVDYKTGAIPTRKGVSEGRELQLALYALAVEVGAVDGLPAHDDGWRLAEGGFYRLRRRDRGLQVVLDGRDALATGVGIILEQALAVLDPEVPFALVPGWQEGDATGRLPCEHCEFRGVCRLEERDTSTTLSARLARLLTALGRTRA